MILYKHLTHLTGNDIQFELADKKDDVNARHIYNAFKRGWQERNMETAWYQLVKSVKATGDGAFVGFMNGEKFAWKVLSFLKGDKLFPHYDIKTGELNLLARTYCNFDETGKVVNRFVDVWDNEFYYCFKCSGDATTAVEKFKQAALSFFNMSGYSLIQKEPHGFEHIPVAYQRNDMGACWTLSQESIDNYEMAFSRMAQSNHDFGLPIMYVKGEGSEEVATQDMSHVLKIFILPSDGEMGFLNRQDASNGYEKELSVLEKQIYTQSFAVTPPELKSGDLPAAALKILYSPAYEKAMSDANEFDGAVDKMVEIFSHGYGIETGKQLKFKSTPIAHYIKPYVHLNETELTTNLSMQVQNGYLSKQTASEKSVYATPQEWDRVLSEKKSEQENDLLFDEKKIIMEQKQNEDPKNEGSKKEDTQAPNGNGKFVWDKNRNKVNPITGKAYPKWEKWNIRH